MKISLLPAALLTLSLSAGAAPQMCFDQAGKDYQIDPLLLMSISIKESHLVPDAINGSNRNGTEDVCGIRKSDCQRILPQKPFILYVLSDIRVLKSY